ncbi:SulP family inorganic anion transporter [Falsiroseomonas sp. HW251]|uniref:SulP family inorganic anion transporter n=1 Tax=Falsiroseomonas sp. HW251 TaxID=3390998 RepID=UPI003D30FAFE
MIGFPPAAWLGRYSARAARSDLVSGVTLAAYAIPVALAYAALAGLPPQVGIYGYMLGGIGYALLGSSRQLAIGPTSAISLMVGASVAGMAGGDPARHLEIATLTAFAVALVCLVAWVARLSVLVKLISDSVLIGFRAGAGITIALTQMPSLFGVPGGGTNVIERVVLLAGQIPGTNPVTLALGAAAIALLLLGARRMPTWPVGLGVVVLGILCVTAFGLRARGVVVTGAIPPGLPGIGLPSLGFADVDGIFPLAAGCVLLAYIEGISAARSFAEKHGYDVNPRQELLALGSANLFAGLGGAYPVAGGLSQTAVNERAGAVSPLSLLVCSATLAFCLLFLTGPLADLPKAVLAAIVLTAVAGLIDLRALARLCQLSRTDFVAAAVALAGVLLFGILQGVLLAALASVLMLLLRASRPHVAFLGRVPGTAIFGDTERHPDNLPIEGVLAFRPEASLLYVNADNVLDAVRKRLDAGDRPIRLVVCDLSSSPTMDLAGARMLRTLHDLVSARRIGLRIVGARGRVRDLLRREGLAALVGGIERDVSLDQVASEAGGTKTEP